ncbi:hypothetical protein HYPSUDRAFT_204412 [Hypholoma sublateritium FD-334 SS-4]|uniref:Uncharacterized protein n=1 Tax=Hypholoma sublateritium (strain FD-334 SS-4) TaxID=945553 RepID=A0A0D2NLF2_HYPSF|nr:hypothetical protein HYPSUDRAFT_204412 [Hypholoma sublateritium FD-334 SS-4]
MPQGAPNTRYKWSARQHAILEEEMLSFRTNIANIIDIDNPQTSVLTAWKQRRAQEIMDLPEFRGELDFSEIPEVQWCKVIVAKFTNTWNTKIVGKAVKIVKKGKVKHAVEAGLETVTENEDCQNEDELKLETAKIMKERRAEPSFTAPARNMALATLWQGLTSAQKDMWHRRSQMMADDIVTNRQEFPTLIAETLQALCDRGRLGTTIMALNYAFRDEHDGLVSGAVYVGTDVSKKMKCVTPMKTHDEWFNLWKEHAQEVVPESVASRHVLVKMNADGFPLFPEIQERKANPEQVAGSLIAYITALWVFDTLFKR